LNEMMNVEVVDSKTNYTFHWLIGEETYETLLKVRTSGSEDVKPFELFIAYGFRKAFGKERRRVLIFRSQADIIAEFVGTDDWNQSRQVATFLRRDGSKKYLRYGEPIPSRYSQFSITESHSVITGPYSPQCFAALVDEKDIPTLVKIAIAREEGEVTVEADWPTSSISGTETVTLQTDNHLGNKEAVVKALLDYRAKQKTGGPFTKNPKADELLRQNQFSFLMAASIDRGARAESVWEIPHILKEKLGHLDPKVLSQFSIDQMETILRLLAKKPRYPRQAAQTIISLSKLVTDEFLGDASSIWCGKQPRQVTQTLEKIWGVGPGIAHMIVRILVDEYNYDPGREGLRQIDVKPDVQVRRVFYRSGIAQDRKESTAVRVARQLHPEFPGLLDWPAWEIGRAWCHGHNPECSECPLRSVCSKRDV
jgi:endonuclease-3